MKHLFYFCMFLSFVSMPKAQAQEIADDSIYKLVERRPEFPGGDEAFRRFFTNNIKMPRDKVPPTTVLVTFVVEKDGTLSGINASRSPSPSVTQAINDVLARSPHWTPGFNDNKRVRVRVGFPFIVGQTR
ncbi:MAG TPA: hypothetical protein VK183_10720 [Flavobacterium sp.]|nr:hypothetical protein [Flavobacterium sp.]